MKQLRIVVVMPAYYAAKTLEKKNLVSEIILVDDNSRDETIKIAKQLGITVYKHPNNLGYGGNQKTCYWEALKQRFDIIVMLHPDYQYDGSMIERLIEPIKGGHYDVMLGNRVHTRKQVLDSGMPMYKYIGNRLLTIIENLVFGENLPEWHTGLRAFRGEVLETVPFQRFSDDFVFDQQILVSALSLGFKVGSINIPCRYFKDSSSINFFRSVKYGLEIMILIVNFWLHKLGMRNRLFLSS